jgi:hypothetical protein
VDVLVVSLLRDLGIVLQQITQPDRQIEQANQKAFDDQSIDRDSLVSLSFEVELDLFLVISYPSQW